MKASEYNFFISDVAEGVHLVYNSLKNTLIFDENSKFQRFIKDCKGDITGLNHIVTEDEYNVLVSSGAIVSNETNERLQAINRNKRKLEIQQKQAGKLSLVIAPTLQCNFKCYYCFESSHSRKKEEYIHEDVRKDIIQFITKSIVENQINEVEIGWYGGEPLVQSSIVILMQKEINNVCKMYNVKSTSYIITNGVLLTP